MPNHRPSEPMNSLTAIPFNNLSTLVFLHNRSLWAPWYASLIVVVNITGMPKVSCDGSGLTGLMGNIAGCVRASTGKFVFKVGR